LNSPADSPKTFMPVTEICISIQLRCYSTTSN